MKVVVTGGSGQLGTLVLERLVANRKIKKIVSLDLIAPAVPSSRIDWRIADLRDPGLERHLEGADALLHLAFIVMKQASVDTMYAVNVEGSRRIFAAAAQHGVRRIVYSSSVAAYGTVKGHPPLIVESTPRRRTPTLTYADNKYEVEEHLDVFEMSHPDIAVVRLRPGILMGRRMSLATPSFLRRRVLPVVGDARSPIVWDEDVADAVMRSLDDDVKGAFNLVASDPIPGAELARLAGFRPLAVPRAAASAATRASSVLAPLLGEKRLDAGWLDAADVDLNVSAERARTVLGWAPRYPTSRNVAAAFGEAAPRTTDRRVSWFFSAVSRLANGAAERGELGDVENLKLALHIDVTGPNGGDYALTFEQGKVTLKPGIPRPPSSTVSLDVATLLDLLAGRGEVATALLVGKLRVRGEPMGSAVLSGIIDGFRRSTSTGGVRGSVARGLSRWFEKRTR
ncbi:MAG TPA: NAD-dependent epimerase/dehydratase family protein [Polyangiaceae bacterium]|nr:NAD-dependent epimerase/dehydratase family protein [Polyangiaceae bacterium]